MAGISTRGDDNRNIGRLLLISLLLWVGCNHGTRALAKSTGGGPSSFEDFASGIFGSVVSSLEGFRLDIGHGLSKASTACPKGAQQYCAKGIGGLRILLGLHE